MERVGAAVGFVVALVVTAFGFWLFGRADEGLHQSWDDTTCLSGAHGWAVGQAVLAAAAALVAGVVAWRTLVRGAVARAPLVLAAVLLVGWVLLVTVGDPREDLGSYAGCGLA